MKVVINKCFGGYGLSSEALEKIAERKGEKLYWFDWRHEDYKDETLIPLDSYEDSKDLFGPIAYTVPNPDENTDSFSHREIERTDPDLIAVIEELGAAANSRHAELAVVEIPDDIKWSIEEYDGQEWVAEQHRTWG